MRKSKYAEEQIIGFLKLAIARRLKWLFAAAAAGLLLPLAARLSDPLPNAMAWVLDLAVHWQWLYAGALCICAMALALLTRGLTWLIGLLAAALPWFTAAPPADAAADASAPGSSSTFTLATANVEVNNTDPERLLHWLRGVQADAVVVLEVSPAIARALEAQTDFAVRKVLPSDDPFGIALLSRHPASQLQVRQLGAGIDYITARLQWHGRELAVSAVHTMPPLFGASSYRARDGDIAKMLAEHRVHGSPALVAGDLNATAWSSALFQAQREGFRRTTSLMPTWPTALHSISGIPIDHVLASPEWRVAESLRGPDIGSDHFPVAVRLVLR